MAETADAQAQPRIRQRGQGIDDGNPDAQADDLAHGTGADCFHHHAAHYAQFVEQAVDFLAVGIPGSQIHKILPLEILRRQNLVVPLAQFVASRQYAHHVQRQQGLDSSAARRRLLLGQTQMEALGRERLPQVRALLRRDFQADAGKSRAK